MGMVECLEVFYFVEHIGIMLWEIVEEICKVKLEVEFEVKVVVDEVNKFFK